MVQGDAMSQTDQSACRSVGPAGQTPIELDLTVIMSALEDAIEHNKLIFLAESMPDTEESDQPPEVIKAIGKIRIFARLAGNITKDWRSISSPSAVEHRSNEGA